MFIRVGITELKYFEQTSPRWTLFILIALLLGAFPGITISQDIQLLKSSYPLFDTHEPLEITLEFDIKKVLRDRGEETDYHPLFVSFGKDKIERQSVAAQVKVRGNFRKKRKNCRFPPLRMRFETDSVSGTVFKGQKKLKLVTHCQTKRSEYQQYVLQEYLIYRSYNIITDKSFRVRLVKINYKDIQGKDDTFTRYGFILEDEDKMAKRLGGRILDVKNVHPNLTDYELGNLLAIFQYMIGNTDWSISALHNIKLVMPKNEQTPYAIPYDFDWSGIIDAGYARPNPILNIQSIRQRLFRGFCRSPEAFSEAFMIFNAKKDSIYALYRELLPILSKEELQQATGYLDEFYTTINDPEESNKEIIAACRTDR